MIWATVSSQSCFYWLYWASPSLAAENIITLISVLTIWWCPWVESSLVLLEEGVCYDQCLLLAKLVRHCPASFCTPLPNLPVTSGISGEGNGNPLQYSCLKNSMDCHLRSLVGDSPWSRKELDTTEWLHFGIILGFRILHYIINLWPLLILAIPGFKSLQYCINMKLSYPNQCRKVWI